MKGAQGGATRQCCSAPEDGTHGIIGGNPVQFKITREHTGGAFATLAGTLAPGRIGAPPHRHTGIDEVARVLEGELTILVEDELVRVPAGGWRLRPRGQIHSFWNGGSRPVKFIEMYLPGAPRDRHEDQGPAYGHLPRPQRGPKTELRLPV